MNPAEHMSLVVETENASEEGATGPMIRPEMTIVLGPAGRGDSRTLKLKKLMAGL
jgi:hypothetical protein